ncbi:MAG: GDP-mannose 4,6-dehydratase [Archangium sp.]|nr:GDP-mannose 4,6-dehydratase [Archangium sp.]
MCDLLVAKGYRVFGFVRDATPPTRVPREVTLIHGDLTRAASIRDAVAQAAPDQLYNFGGVTDLATAYQQPELTWQVNAEAVATMVDAALEVNPAVRFLQASSSEVFLPSEAPLTEASPRDWQTQNPYAKAKMAVDRDVIARARARGGFAVSAILFNHESPRRSDKSVLRKIARTLARIRGGDPTPLRLGNLDMARDWGFAGDYAEAMWRMLQREVADDFVIATGRLHTVKDAVEIAAAALGLELRWSGEGADTIARDVDERRVVEVDPTLFRPAERHPKVGDPGKASRLLGWRSTVGLRALVELMVRAELSAAVQP